MTSCSERGSRVNADELGREAVGTAEAVREAIRFVRTLHHEPTPPSLTKLDASPVTIADFVIQALVVSRLAQDFPGDPIMAEEDAAPLRTQTGAELRRGYSTRTNRVTRTSPSCIACFTSLEAPQRHF